MTQNRIVEFKCAFDFFDHGELTLDVQQSVMRFVDLVDRVRQLPTAPIFAAVNSAT